MCKKEPGIVMPNFVVLRAAVFYGIYKNLQGGGYPPLVGARVKVARFPPQPKNPGDVLFD